MDYESDLFATKEDLLYSKIVKALNKSSNLLHKKAIVLITSIKQKFSNKSTQGIEGLKQYAKTFIDLLITFTKIDELSSNDILNYEATFFTLSVCLKQLPSETIKNRGFLDRLYSIMTFSFENLLRGNFNIMKYAIIIIEKILYSLSKEELANPKNEVVMFYQQYFFIILMFALKSTEEGVLLQKYLTKSICKVLKDKTEHIKYTIIKAIIEFIKIKLQKMAGKSGIENEIFIVPISQGEYILKFLSTMIQFLSFDIVNDLIIELHGLIEATESKNILMNSFLCLDLAFSTKAFALETSETVLKLLLNKDILLSDGLIEETEFKGMFLVSYIKAITQVLLSVNSSDQIQSLKYFIAIVSMFSEFLTDQDEFIKGSVFNSLQNLINKLLNPKALNDLFNVTKANELTLEISLEPSSQQFNGDFLLEKIADCLLYLLSSRYEDNKMGYNLLLIFLEAINKCTYSQNINSVNEKVLMALSENESKRSDMLKIFIGKCFNLMSASLLIKYFPLSILGDDITSESYTENSNVWVLSFMDKFLREGVQTIAEYAKCFMIVVNELEEAIVDLKQKKVVSKDSAQNDMMIDDNEENNNLTQHLKELMIKRYELILTQTISQLPKYTGWCDKYSQYLEAFLIKFEGYFTKNETCHFISSLNDIMFRFLSKVISIVIKQNDHNSIEIIRTKGSFFFQKTYNLILSHKLNKSELSEAFNLIEKYCKVINIKFIHKIILDMIDKCNDVFTQEEGKPKPKQEPVVPIATDKDLTKNKKDQKNKGINNQKKIKDKIALRIDITNYLLRNISDVQLKDQDNNYIQILFSFFEKHFFTKEKNSSYNQITKRLFDLFIILIVKKNNKSVAFDTCKQFISRNGLELISPKQKSKLFEFMIRLIIDKYTPSDSMTIDFFKSHFTILIDLMTLTKDINRKVRNTAYELIGQLTKFLTSKQLFGEWETMLIASLASTSVYIKSAGINALARTFWENRYESEIVSRITSNASMVLLLFKDNNKEIIKSLFIYVRVLLFIIKARPFETNKTLLFSILHYSLVELSENHHKEFKVKLRNLLKNLTMNFSYENIKSIIPDKQEPLLQYVNKHLVKKIKEMTAQEEESHGYNKCDLDDSVMLDNDANLLDEEEDYIKKEFKKMENKDNDLKILERVENFDIEEEEMEAKMEIEKEKEEKNNKNSSVDKIEELFVKDNVQLNNFFYVNPYVFKSKIDENKQLNNAIKKEKDVQFDSKKGKLIVKDIEKEIEESKMLKKKRKDLTAPLEKDDIPNPKLLKQKRVQNVIKDKDDIEDNDEENILNSRTKKMKISDTKSVIKPIHQGHYVKFSGDEYKNKKAKGDKLLLGKLDPFAYIQLNPKAIGKKGARENLKIFETLMKNDNKH